MSDDMGEDLIDLDVGIDEVSTSTDFGDLDLKLTRRSTLDGKGELLFPVISTDQQDENELAKKEVEFFKDPDALITHEALAKRSELVADERSDLLGPRFR